MSMFQHFAIQQILYSATLIFLLVGSLAGLAVGVALLARSPAIFRLFNTMRNWKSTRAATKPLDLPRDHQLFMHRHRKLIGTVFVAVAGVSIGLIWHSFDVAAVSALFGKRFNPHLVVPLVTTLKWALLICDAIAIVVGIILISFPAVLTRAEVVMNAWVSSRLACKGFDTMHLTLDKWVEANPRSSGAIVVVFALFAAMNLGLILLGNR